MTTWLEETDEGARRVTLRAERWDRVVTVPILAMKLFVWWGVWMFLVNLVLAWFGLWRIPAPAGIAEMVERSSEGRPAAWIVALVVLFVAGWTWAGLVTIRDAVRLWIGSDSVTMFEDRMRFSRSVGPFVLERDIARDRIAAIGIRGRNRDLVIEEGGRQVIIATLGLEADRRRLGGELRSRYGLMTPGEREPGALPKGWQSAAGPDGAVRLELPRGEQRPFAGCALIIAVVWWILVAFRFYAKTSRGEPFAPTGGDWVAIFLGAALIALYAIAARATKSIELRRNLLVLKTSIGSWKKTREFRNATLSVAFHTQARGSGTDYFRLDVDANGGSQSLFTAVNDATEAVALGRFVARETGWPLDIAPQARDLGSA
jgi:hypothetical protein